MKNIPTVDDISDRDTVGVWFLFSPSKLREAIGQVRKQWEETNRILDASLDVHFTIISESEGTYKPSTFTHAQQ